MKRRVHYAGLLRYTKIQHYQCSNLRSSGYAPLNTTFLVGELRDHANNVAGSGGTHDGDKVEVHLGSDEGDLRLVYLILNHHMIAPFVYVLLPSPPASSSATISGALAIGATSSVVMRTYPCAAP
eukprot:scaffold547_cov384-Prasinococcus_capsulatus_cf.AAC.6